jgi:hypothetical protein
MILRRTVGSSLEPFGPVSSVEVKLDHYFAKLLGNQQRRGERHERSPFGRPGFCVVRVPSKATDGLTGRAREISRVLGQFDPVANGIDLLPAGSRQSHRVG